MIASRFAADASAFRAALLPSDIATIALSRNLFHLSWLLPLGLYALFEPPGPTRLFPMSISWTIRKGLPRRLHNALWVAGWGLFLSVVLRATGGLGLGLLLGGSSGSGSLVAIFILQMVVTGACATILCPLGSGRKLQDTVHWCAALAYMVDHVFLFGLLRTPPSYVIGFWSCFALMAAAQKYTTPDATRVAMATSSAGSPVAEWAFMLGEYGLFIFFLNGMVRGL